MSMSTKQRALASLETLERLRRLEEETSLRDLQRSRKALDEEQGRLSEIRERRRQATTLAESLHERGVSTPRDREECELVRQLAFIDLLRGDESRHAERVARRRDAWTELE